MTFITLLFFLNHKAIILCDDPFSFVVTLSYVTPKQSVPRTHNIILFAYATE